MSFHLFPALRLLGDDSHPCTKDTITLQSALHGSQDTSILKADPFYSPHQTPRQGLAWTLPGQWPHWLPRPVRVNNGPKAHYQPSSHPL